MIDIVELVASCFENNSIQEYKLLKELSKVEDQLTSKNKDFLVVIAERHNLNILAIKAILYPRIVIHPKYGI